MTTKLVEVQDHEGTIYYPHTDSSVVKHGDSTVSEELIKWINQSSALTSKLSDLIYETARGTGTNIVLSTQELVDGYHKTFIASEDNNGQATTINTKPLYKPVTTTPPTLVRGRAYTVWYNKASDCFFIKASAEGTATESTVLAGYTFSNDNDTGLKGTMRNYNNKIADWCHFENITVQPHPADPSQGLVTIPMAVVPEVNSGYYGSGSKIQANIASLNAGNIKAGVKVGRSDGSAENCITGTFTSDATARPEHMLSGQTAYVNGNKITGNIPDRGTHQYAGRIGSADDYLAFNNIPYGYYPPSSNGWAPEIRARMTDIRSFLGIIASKIVRDQQIAGVQGSANQLKYVTGEMVVQSNGYRQLSFTIPSTGFNVIAFSAWNASSLSSCGPVFGCNLGGNFTMTLDYANSRNSSQSPSYKNYFTTSVVLHSPATMTNYTIRWIAIGY